jgi:hypothetical protein
LRIWIRESTPNIPVSLTDLTTNWLQFFQTPSFILSKLWIRILRITFAFRELYMQHTEGGVVIDPDNVVKLHPAMHLLGTEYDKNQLYGICFDCGKENTECSIAI